MSYNYRFRIDIGFRNTKERDVALRFKPRFKKKTEVIRNTRSGYVWGRQEAWLPGFFPFQRGHNFEVIILCDKDKFKVLIYHQYIINIVLLATLIKVFKIHY